jgi:hypothetical protein
MRQNVKYYILWVISRSMFGPTYLNGNLRRIFNSNSMCGLHLITKINPICFPNSGRYVYIDIS